MAPSATAKTAAAASLCRRRALKWACALALGWTFLLLYAGAFTTSIRAGMAFPDWPLSNGSLNPDGWLADESQRAEHGHRLIAVQLGLIALGLALWHQRVEPRPKVRLIAWALPALVLAQGVLGGLRVLLDRQNLLTEGNGLAQTFAISHALGAQAVLLALIALTLAHGAPTTFAAPPRPRLAPVYRLGLLAVFLLLIQAALGAILRHGGAGLAIPYFPTATADGAFLPPAWTAPVAVAFAHRIGAVIATVLSLWFLHRWHRAFPHTGRVATSLAATLVACQFGLGALAVWSSLAPVVTAFHTVGGAALTGLVWYLTLRAAPSCLAAGKPSSPQAECAPC